MWYKVAMVQVPTDSSRAELVRAIGRWSMVALAVNSIVGSGIFGLPAPVAGLLGRASPLAVLLAGAGMGVIIARYAEVASQFTETGGTYLYLRHAFGRLAGLQVVWLMLLSRLTAVAAAVNLLDTHLAEFWPRATQPLPRLAIITGFIGVLAAVNCRGVGAGTRMSNASVVAKLGALGLVCAAGIVWLTVHPAVAAPPLSPSADSWLKAMLLLLFAYGGYEAALNPMGEARDPRRDVAFALFVALVVVTLLYSVLQWVVVGVLADPAHSQRPLADAARVMLGQPGAALISVGALVSVYGYVSANMLTTPRGIFAPAQAGELPALLGAVHPRWRTPYVSILVFAVLLWAFSQFASFSWNVTLSAVSRIVYYAGICAAVPVLRRKQPGAAAFRVPGGVTLPVLGVAICALLLTRVDFGKSLILLATIAVALLNWALVRDRGLRAARAQR
ncbi:MAG TPA: APC family permease [Steroidobacteraceae bacterium]|nr:APC family permease [Steroidobacteraceae bacterium]